MRVRIYTLLVRICTRLRRDNSNNKLLKQLLEVAEIRAKNHLQIGLRIELESSCGSLMINQDRLR